jgi:hypothetical protein
LLNVRAQHILENKTCAYVTLKALLDNAVDDGAIDHPKGILAPKSFSGFRTEFYAVAFLVGKNELLASYCLI